MEEAPKEGKLEPFLQHSLSDLLPHARLRRWTLLFTFPIAMLVGTGIVANLPAIAAAFPNASQGQVAFLLNGSALAMGFSTPLGGHLVDKIGRRAVMLTTILGCGLFGALPFFLNNFALITASRIILGLSAGANMSVSTTMIADYYEDAERASMMGLAGATTQGLAILVLVATGTLSEVGWRIPFLLYAAALLVFIPAWISLLEPPKKGNGVVVVVDDEDGESGSDAEKSSEKIPIMVLAPFLAGIFTFGAFSQGLTYLPFYLEELGYDSSVTGYVIATATFTGFPVALTFGRLATVITNAAIQAWILSCMGASLLLLAVSTSLPFIFFSQVLNGAGLAYVQANLNLWVTKLAPESRRGLATGVVNATLFFAQGLLAQFTAPIVEASNDFTVAFWFGFWICVVGAVGYGMLASITGWTVKNVPASEAE